MQSTSAFDLPDRLSAKADPALIARDERHFAAIQHSLDTSIADLTDQLAAERKAPAGGYTQAVERDQQVHRLTARLRTLRRYGLDLCLGHFVRDDDPEPVYIGRLGLGDETGERLLIDWRSPAAEPFFAATHANPGGVGSRRRYRWSGGRITDYWDEVFSPGGLDGHSAALDEDSAFIASLGSTRSSRMRDVLATIQADQDEIIRARSSGALVVDGGPGTGKTVVALHRAAYLLYADPRLRHYHGGILFVGPHQPYLTYIADVLPSLGEEGVQTCTLRDLVPGGDKAAEEKNPDVAGLKSTARVVEAIESAVRFYEEAPTKGIRVETDWGDLRLTAADWTEAFETPAPGFAHNDARDQIWLQLLEILVDRFDFDDDAEVTPDELRASLARNRELATAFNAAWPLLTATDLVADLWSVPAYLRRCAPWLTTDEVRALQRDDASAWTVSDLPWLDAARLRLGDPDNARRQRRREAAAAAAAEQMNDVVDTLIEHDGSEMQVMSMLRGQDLQEALVDHSAVPDVAPDLLAGPFAHIVVDEAQELTDADWQMVLQRCPSQSLTIVGDRAQARHGFVETWQERLQRVGIDHVSLSSLTINYRTPEEVMLEAEPVIRAALPDANVPASIRSSGRPVRRGHTGELVEILDEWLAANDEGIGCVISTEPITRAQLVDPARIRGLTPVLAKGLEFDLVVLVEPDSFGSGIEGAVDRYVAMTRATQQLVILTRPRARSAPVTVLC